jgi:hypothetical protein
MWNLQITAAFVCYRFLLVVYSITSLFGSVCTQICVAYVLITFSTIQIQLVHSGTTTFSKQGCTPGSTPFFLVWGRNKRAPAQNVNLHMTLSWILYSTDIILSSRSKILETSTVNLCEDMLHQVTNRTL